MTLNKYDSVIFRVKKSENDKYILSIKIENKNAK